VNPVCIIGLQQALQLDGEIEWRASIFHEFATLAVLSALKWSQTNV
jgi:hypothetical protein